MSGSPRRHRGRQPRVPGGYPYTLEVRLTESDWVRLTVAAVRAEKADGAYASQLVRRGLAGEFDTVPADWRDVMAQLVAHRSALAGCARTSLQSADCSTRLLALSTPAVTPRRPRRW